MKKSDIALLAIIVSVSLGIAYFAGQALIGLTQQQGNAEVETVEPISSEVQSPDASVFSKDAINPAVPIKIGDSTNQQPFGQ